MTQADTIKKAENSGFVKNGNIWQKDIDSRRYMIYPKVSLMEVYVTKDGLSATGRALSSDAFDYVGFRMLIEK